MFDSSEVIKLLPVPDHVVIDYIREHRNEMLDSIENIYRDEVLDCPRLRNIVIEGTKKGLPVKIQIWGVWGEELNRYVIRPFQLNPEKENHRAIMKQHRLILLDNWKRQVEA